MTLKTICTDALLELGELETPTAFAASTNNTAKILFRMANTEISELRRRHDWQALMKDQSISTVTDQEEYDLPADYDRYAPDAYNDRSNRRVIHGPLTAAQYQSLKRSDIESGFYRYFRLRGNKILFYPVPQTTGDEIVFEYVSRFAVEDSGGTEKQYFTADSDVALIDEYLITLGVIWRARRQLGLRYDAEKLRYENEVSKEIARDKGMGTINLGRPRRKLAHVQLPDGDFGL